MNLEEFAISAGVGIVDVDPKKWGKPLGYQMKDAPRTTVCGFRTKELAYKHWLENEFGAATAKSLMKLLKQTEK